MLALLNSLAAMHTVRIPQWGTASALEIAWTAAGGLVLAVVVPNYVQVRTTLAARVARLPATDREIARVIVHGYVRREVLRGFKGCVMVAIGVVGMYEPNPTPSVASYTGLVLTAGLFVLGLTVALQSMLDRSDRERIDAIQHLPGRRWWPLRWWRHTRGTGH